MVQIPESPLFERVRLRGNPLAAPGAAVVRGRARFTMLTERLVRLEWSANGRFEDRATFAFPNRYAPPPPFTVDEAGGVLTIDTGALAIRYRPNTGPFSPGNLSIAFELNGEKVRWAPGTPKPGNLRGTRRTLDGAAGPVALSEGLLSRDGWALYDDSAGVLFTEGGGWVEPRPGHDLQDWYFFGYGHDYTAALSEYTRFGGPIPLIPRFVLGAWWSRYWAYSAQDLEQLVEDFSAHDLPLDVLVIDMDWHTPHAWTGYTWNRELFPDPAAFLAWVHSHGLHATLNLHPAEGVQPFEEAYADFASALGIDPVTKEPVPFQPGSPAFMQQYFEMLHHPMEDQGVDFWWLDWQQGEASDIPGLDPLLWLNHLHFLDSARMGHRPMLYSRWGGLGNHRYYIGFSGDTYGVWPALAALPHFTATASNVLYGWWSHDIGGHFGADTPELYARWVQFGALSPCLRLHSAKAADAERRPWTFPEPVFEAARAAFHWRYAMVPYLYTMAREATETGISLCRPLYYAYPEAEAAYLARDEYFLGDAMIAAPIVRPSDLDTGLASVDVWVPEGTWIDYETHESFTGPRWVRLVGDVARMPRLVREGAVLPQARVAPTTKAIPADELIVEVFPGREGSFRLYEDDGATSAYLEGQYEWTPITMQTTEDGVCTVAIGPTEGECDALPAERAYEVRLAATQRPERVLIDGAEVSDWHYDEAAGTTVVSVPHTSKRARLEVRVEAAGELSALSEEHNLSCVQADVRRLLGSAYPNVPTDRLLDAVLAVDHPGRLNAVARLGGPFVSVFDNVTLPEAARCLGELLVAAPADGTPYDCTVTWTLHGSDGDDTRTEHLRGATGDQVLRSPFAFSGAAQPVCWEVGAAIQWRGASLLYRHRSPVLFPTLPAWRVAVSQGKALSPRRKSPDLSSPGLEWRVYEEDPQQVASLAEPFVVLLGESHREELARGVPLVAYASTIITAAQEREVRLAYDTPGALNVWINGEPAPEDRSSSAPVLEHLPATRQPRVTVPVSLHAGENTLLLAVTPLSGGGDYGFAFAAQVLEPNGTPAMGLRYTAGSEG